MPPGDVFATKGTEGTLRLIHREPERQTIDDHIEERSDAGSQRDHGRIPPRGREIENEGIHGLCAKSKRIKEMCTRL